MDASIDAYVGLGANLGDAPATLAGAVRALRALPETSGLDVSRLYRTRPVGPLDQPDFHNAAARLRVVDSPVPEDGAMALLLALKGIERTFGREPGPRWGPRHLDLDLLLYGEHSIHVEPEAAPDSADGETSAVRWLEVPHPEAAVRSFVLAPLADLAPELRPPGWPRTIRQSLAVASEQQGIGAVTAVAAWDERAGAWTGLPGNGLGQ